VVLGIEASKPKAPLGRPRSFLPDWPVPEPVPGGSLRPVFNPDGNETMRSFRAGLERKLVRNQNWLLFSQSPRPGTEPHLLPSGSVPAPCLHSPRREHATTQQRRRRGGTR